MYWHLKYRILKWILLCEQSINAGMHRSLANETRREYDRIVRHEKLVERKLLNLETESRARVIEGVVPPVKRPDMRPRWMGESKGWKA